MKRLRLGWQAGHCALRGPGQPRRHWTVVLIAVLATLMWVATASAVDAPSADQFSIKGVAEYRGTSVAGVITPGALLGHYGLESPLVTGSGDQHYPSISGDYVVFETLVPDADIKLYNRKANAVTDVSVHASSLQWRPRISGNRIVWMDSRNGNWDIYWYDIAKKTEHRLTTDLGHQEWPEIDGDRVVWEDYRWGPPEIVTYSFATGRTTRLTTDSFLQYAPKVSGNRFVWMDNRNGNYDIYWYDIGTKTERRISEWNSDDLYPTISGNHVAWMVDYSGGYDIAVLDYIDATTQSRWYYAPVAGAQHSPRIHGDTLVWVDEGSGVAQLRTRLLGIGWDPDSLLMTSGASNKLAPDFYRDTVVWYDNRAGNSDVYSMRLPAPTLTLSAPSSAGYGATTNVSGYLTNWDGTRLANRDVEVRYVEYAKMYDMNGGLDWPVKTVKTNSLGKFTAAIPTLPNKFFVRAYFAGDPDVFQQVSSQKTVLPKVYLGKPSGPTSIAEDKAFTVRGSLKPKHTAGTKPVRIQLYKKSGDTYVYKTSYTASVYDYDTYSKYRASIKLTSPGKWRYRAYYPTSSTNYKTYSDFRYVTAY